MKKLLAIGMILLSHSAWADWVFIGVNDVGDTFHVDPTTKKPGNLPRVWVFSVKGSKHQEDRDYRSTKILREADCKEGKTRGLSYNYYKDVRGTELLESDNSPKDWSYPPPGSVMETLFVYLCGKAP